MTKIRRKGATKIRRTGKRRFPKLHDKDFMDWLTVELLAGAECDNCGGRATERAHVIPKGRGTHRDMGNVCLLCPRCHRETEKRPAPELQERAAVWAEAYTRR